MASIEEEIVTWAASRPVWLQNIIARIAQGGVADQAFIDEAAQALTNGSLALTSTLLQREDLASGMDDDAQVTLLSISDLSNVNALLSGQRLSFGESGITLVYGDNGSGKSGYARLIKDIAGARHKEKVLPDAFNPSGDALPQAAGVEYSVSGSSRTSTWPQIDDLSVKSIHFYDEACGDDYIASETEVSYRPSVLKIFDQLITVADALRSALDQKFQTLSVPVVLPQVDAGTASAEFLQSLTVGTSLEDIDAACKVEDDAEEALGRLGQEHARLQATNPTNEKSRLNSAATSIAALADHFDALGAIIGFDHAEKAVRQRADAHSLRSAATLASSRDFADEPLSGVGTATWRALWSATEAYVKSGAYPEETFPPTADTDHCPLCQQVLAEGARDRLGRFYHFVHDQTEGKAREAEDAAQRVISKVEAQAISTPATTTGLLALQTEDADRAARLREALEAADRARNRLVSLLTTDNDASPLHLVEVETPELRTLASEIKERAQKIDETEFRRQINEVHAQQRNLKARMALSVGRQSIINEVQRQVEQAKIKRVRDSVSTTSITAQSTALTRTYVTSKVKDRFARESERLHLSKVALSDLGGAKGRLRHRPALLGVGAGRPPKAILSEGEQTALGLAGLFTEIYFDESKSAVVLDDPVSSLSHAWRKDVARRVVELAENRQVIVFTHDLTFLGYLAKAAEADHVPVTERCIERTGGSVPGAIKDDYPWKAKDAPARFDKLRTRLAHIKREKDAWSQDEYLQKTSEWAGMLSETYERIVRAYVINQVVDRATTQVSPRMFRMLVKITDQDNQDFQEGYSEVSEWARRHDKSEDTNFVAPTVEKMESELDKAHTWFKRIKSYH